MKRRYNGEIFLLYVAWYGFGRGLIEGLRADSLYLFGTGLRISQAVGFASCVVALGVLVYLYLFRESDPEKLANPYYAVKKGEAEETAAEPEEELAPMAGDDEESEDDESFYGEAKEAVEEIKEEITENKEND